MANRRIQKIFILTAIVVFIPAFFSVCNNNSKKYSLSQKQIRQVSVLKLHNGHYGVLVELEEPYKSYFAELTRINIGKKLIVSFDGQKLMEAIIKSEISSGHIMIDRQLTQSEAEQVKTMFLAKP